MSGISSGSRTIGRSAVLLRAAERPRTGLTAASWWACAAIAAIVLTLPLSVVDVPPLLDYPNHLARMVVLANGPGDPAISAMYATHWSIIPNVAIDLIIPSLLQILPVHIAGRLVLGLVLLVQCAGMMAYHRALFRQLSLWPVASALVAYNTLFLLGFLNFLLAIGIAFLVAAVWLAFRRRHPVATCLFCSLCAVALFFCHLFGVVFLAILVGAHEAEGLLRRWQQRRPMVRATAASAGLLGVLLFPTAALYLMSAFNGDSSTTQWLPWPIKLVGLLQPLLNYDTTLDLVTAALFMAFIALCVRFRRWSMPPSSIITFVLLLVLYAVAPFTAKGGAWIDSRFVICAAFMLFAGCRPTLSGWPARATVLAAVCLLLFRTGLVATVWAEHRTDLRELRESIAAVAPRTRVLVVRVGPDVDPQYWRTAPRSRRIVGSSTTEMHDAALLLIERHAFWPLLFATPSQQPITVLPPYHDIAYQLGVPPDYRALLDATPHDLARAPYLANWQTRFDDVLVLDADGVPDLSHLLPGTLERLNDTGFAALYRIERPRQETAAP